MNKFKKILLVTASTLAITTSAMAVEKKSEATPVVSDLKVKISGYSDVEAGFRNQNKLQGNEKNVSGNRNNFGMFSTSAIAVNVSNKVEDIEYGAKMVLVPTTTRKASPSYNGSHIFVESNFGKFEAGSPIVSSATMAIDAGEVTATSLTGWSRYTEFDTLHLKQDADNLVPSFATSADFFLDDKLATNDKTKNYSNEPARSVVYYTPKFDIATGTKVQVGVSYTPDSSNTGAGKPSTISSGIDTKTVNAATGHRFEFDNSVKDAVSGGVAIEHNITDGVDVKIALTGECGKSAGSAKEYDTTANTNNPTVHKLSSLKAYNVGAVLNIGNYSYAGSVGSLGKSLTTPEFHKTGRKTNYYTAAAAYNQGPFAASVGMFKSDQYKNTVHSVSLATSYQLAPGFKPYVAISGFQVKGKPEFEPTLEKKKTRGTVALIGAKLSL